MVTPLHANIFVPSFMLYASWPSICDPVSLEGLDMAKPRGLLVPLGPLGPSELCMVLEVSIAVALTTVEL